MKQKIIVRTADVVNSDLWKLFPAINVDKFKDVPVDYPGVIGVPITALDKIGCNDGSSGFLVLDMLRPIINGKPRYQRLLIRNLKPQLPEEIDLAELLERAGVEIEIEEIIT